MKNNYFFTIQFYAIFFLLLQGLYLPNANAQTNEPVSADPSEHFFDNTRIVRQKPTRYQFKDLLNQDEKHVLSSLTQQETKGIEESTDPPAIGVVRDLKEPIYFRLNASDIPARGEQTVSGGRLTRVNEDTLAWTTYIESETAEELRIYFPEGNFPDGVLVNLFSKDDYAFNQSELHGLLNKDGFYTTTTFADHVYLQVVIPVKALSGDLHFAITQVIHASNKYIPQAPKVDCYQDVNCAYAQGYSGINALKYSTSQLTFVVGGYYYICTGTLLNDLRAADVQPYLLTAHHCFSTQASANSLEARFDLYSTSCNGSTNPDVILINGSNLIATNSQSDFTFVLLQDKPGGYRYYLGWTTAAVANGEILHSVNHPAGIPQKYLRSQNKTSPAYNCGGFSTADFHYTTVLGGQTTGGSSGGSIVLPSGHVVGQLYGVCHPASWSECDYNSFNNMWGRFNVSYNNNNLQYWLNNGGSSVWMSTSPSSSLGFGTGNVGSYYYQTVTVYNGGYTPNYLNLEAGSAYISGTDASQFTIIGTNYLYLDPGTSGSFLIRFNPTSSGAKSATLNIPHNADNIASPRVITLTGNAEPCSNIISLGGGGAANAKTYSKSGTGIWWTSWDTPCGYACPGNEQIYSFVAPQTGFYSIDVSYSNGNYLDYMWTGGNCNDGTWNCFNDIYTVGTYGSAYWTAGNTYYVLVDAENTTLTTQTFAVILNPCSNAVSIGGTGAGYTQTYNGGGNGAWFTASPTPCGYYCPGIENVYSFVAPSTGYYSIQVTGTTEWFVDYMWSTSCGSTGWNCINDVYTAGTYGAMYWTAGTTYYILLDDENSTVGPQTFYINPPDPCLGIIPVACGQTVTFTGGGPGVWNYNACYWAVPGAEQVYSFVAPTTGQYSIQVTATNGSYVDYMWSTSCASGDWNCIQDIYSPGQYGSMSWVAGTTYYILLDDEDNLAGTHTFNIVCPALCHDCPTYDFIIWPDISWQTTSSSIESSGCKIYRFYASSGYKFTFKTGCSDGATANFDTYLHLFDGSCTQVASNDDGCGYPLSKIEWTAVASGYYYLKVRGFSSSYGNYTLAYNACYDEPAQPGIISGPTTVPYGVSQTYSIDPVPGASSYTWSYIGGGTPAGSGPSITLAPTSSGELSVVANNLCGTSLPSYLSITVIPLNLSVQNIAPIPGSPVCYDAWQTLTVAGGGTYFIVPNGSSAEFVAGQNILFLPGTLVLNGGHLLGRIATAGDYCNIVTKASGDGNEAISGNINPVLQNNDQFFKVYPNPTSGDFTLELSAEPNGTSVKVQCYNLMGVRIMEKEFNSGKNHKLTLVDQKPGLYVLKVIQNEETGMQKIIRE